VSSPDSDIAVCRVDVQGWRAAGDGEPGAYVVAVGGDVDITTVATLDHTIEVAVAVGARHVEVDLAGLTFLDSSGLRSLTNASRALTARGGLLTCTQLSQPAKRALELSGLLPHLTRTPSDGSA
jgi:anti-sigma B factor antagonist